MSGKGRKERWQITLLFTTVLLIYLLDQLTKFLAVNLLTQGESIQLIKHCLHITLTYNTGAAFGMFRSHPNLFAIIAVISVFFICIFLLLKHKDLRFLEKLALCFILSGALGNLTDRLRFGNVIDFIDFRVWPVFNAADSFITVGVGILIASIVRGGKR